jgi:hypothetical protein
MLTELPEKFAQSEQQNSKTNPKLKLSNSAPKVQHPLAVNYLSTAQVAEVLGTNVSVIKQSRMTGLLFGRPAPEFIRIGERKLVYEASEIVRWINAGKRGRVSGCES